MGPIFVELIGKRARQPRQPIRPHHHRPPADDLAQLAESVKKLRECERAITTEPPPFVWNKKQGRLPLEDQYIDSRMRLYAWLTSKIDAAPALEELDDAGLMDLAYATAGL